MIKYQDLIHIPCRNIKERLVEIDQNTVLYGYIRQFDDMKLILDNKVKIRESVYKRLILAQKNLNSIKPALSLYVTYGYRSMEIQVKYFLNQLVLESKNNYYDNPQDLYEKIHQKIAVPKVAGHPTGAAVDLLIINRSENVFLDFGSKIYDFSTNKCKYNCKDISSSAKKNRSLLRKIMTNSGFAPYDGEWWHFSYGDREWASFYNKKYALYNQININSV